MQSDIDAQLTSFFEETPPRDFAKVMRGYDPHQVDEHIRTLANEVRRHQEDAVSARRDLQDAQRQIQE
jgi:DivIVA domain-containing protein